MRDGTVFPRWTPEAALAYIEARPGDADADAIIRDLVALVEHHRREFFEECRRQQINDPGACLADFEGELDRG